MEKYQNKYRISSARLPSWDYGSNAAYFITICTKDREHFFGEIIDASNVGAKDAADHDDSVETQCIASLRLRPRTPPSQQPPSTQPPNKSMSSNPTMQLSALGKIVESEWLKTLELRPDMNLELGEFVVMPNHFHGIIIIGENKYNTPGKNGDVGRETCMDANTCRDAMHRVSTGIKTDDDNLDGVDFGSAMILSGDVNNLDAMHRVSTGIKTDDDNLDGVDFGSAMILSGDVNNLDVMHRVSTGIKTDDDDLDGVDFGSAMILSGDVNNLDAMHRVSTGIKTDDDNLDGVDFGSAMILSGDVNNLDVMHRVSTGIKTDDDDLDGVDFGSAMILSGDVNNLDAMHRVSTVIKTGDDNLDGVDFGSAMILSGDVDNLDAMHRVDMINQTGDDNLDGVDFGSAMILSGDVDNLDAMHRVSTVIKTGDDNLDGVDHANAGKSMGYDNMPVNQFAPQSKNLASIVRGFKSSVTTQAKKMGHADFAWQTRFHDHIIRNDESLERIQDYIVNNVINWKDDKFFTS